MKRQKNIFQIRNSTTLITFSIGINNNLKIPLPLRKVEKKNFPPAENNVPIPCVDIDAQMHTRSKKGGTEGA